MSGYRLVIVESLLYRNKNKDITALVEILELLESDELTGDEQKLTGSNERTRNEKRERTGCEEGARRK